MQLKEKCDIRSIAKESFLCSIFRNRYHANYNFMYNMEDYKCFGIGEFAFLKMKEALNAGEQFLDGQTSDGSFNVAVVIGILQDTCVSDREIRALAFTLREFGVIEF